MSAKDTQFSKNKFLENYLIKHKELGRFQRDYRNALTTKLKSRADVIKDAGYNKAIASLRKERNDVRARIWVASSVKTQQENRHQLRAVVGHVDCQEHLIADVQKLKVAIAKMEREVKRVTKQINEFKRKTIPDEQHQVHVLRARKRLLMLEDQLEIGVRRECHLAGNNATLLEEVFSLIDDRRIFNESYGKLVQQLDTDKKYMIELIKYALDSYDDCIAVYEKLSKLQKKDIKEGDIRKFEMQGIMGNNAAGAEINDFIVTKAQNRSLSDLLPKEYRRREKVTRYYKEKIDLYKAVVEKIMEYTGSTQFGQVIRKYQQQESLYYSYFNYTNEMSHHMTLLNTNVNKLTREINVLKNDNFQSFKAQLETIEELETTLKEKQIENEELLDKKEGCDSRLEDLMKGFQSILKISKTDISDMMECLGDQTNINLSNLRGFLKRLERRIYDITAVVYVKERENQDYDPFHHHLVRNIEKFCEFPTYLEDIVLTQQCPECAEGEAFNVDDGGDGGVVVLSKDETKQKISEKVDQPEIQYLLHSISQCRLPRSRVLAAKRNL